MNRNLLGFRIADYISGFTASEALGQHGQDRFSGARWLHPSTHGDYRARNHAHSQPWHGGFYYLQTGQPTALVVPPTATMQQNYSWGVSQNTMTPIYSQFGRGAHWRWWRNVPSHTGMAQSHRAVRCLLGPSTLVV